MDTQSISSDEDDFILPSLCPSPIISSVGVGSVAHSRVGGSEVGKGQSRSPSPDLAESSNTIGERGEQEGSRSPRATSSPAPAPPSEPPPQLIRHDTLWYHDGSIVLHVQDHLFKVHQTVLSAHSEVFAGLFTLPEGKDKDKGRIDGCPVVELQQDKWEDVEVLLRAIYEPAFWDNLQPTTPLPTLLPPLSSLLALSTKYIIPTLRTRTTSLLKSKFPTTYPNYIHRTQSAEKYISSNIMLAIHLARAYDVPEVLPYLFYCLARLSNRRIMESKEGDVSWYLKSLSLVAREKLRLSEIALSHSFLYAFRPSPQCTSPPLCTLSRGPIIEWRLIESQKNPAPLRGWDKWEKLGVCERCVEWCKGEHERGRREVWERLPSLVGVAASWGVLREGGFELGDRA